MCEMVKGQRRTFRDQDPPRICNSSNENLKSELEFCESAPTSPTILQRASSFEKCIGESKYLEKDSKQNKRKEKTGSIKQDSACSDSVEDSADNVRISNERIDSPNQTNSENFIKELSDKVPSNDDEVCLYYLLLLTRTLVEFYSCAISRFCACAWCYLQSGNNFNTDNLHNC